MEHFIPSFSSSVCECVFIRLGGGGVGGERSSPSFTCSVCECINQSERVATDILYTH